MVINILTSESFSFSPPLIIEEALKRGHKVNIFNDSKIPRLSELLGCDIFIDYSAIIDKNFYKNLDIEYKNLTKKNKAPIMIDPPESVISSMDKRLTHKIFPDLIPESYNLDGLSNVKHINKFKNDSYVVIKDPFGWQSNGVERISPEEAIKKYATTKDLIVQKYIPFKIGINRVITLNYKADFEIVCAYTRIPFDWKTDENNYQCQQIDVDDRLYNFANKVSKKSGLYLNGIDYIDHDGKLILLEINTAPGLKEPLEEFGINTGKIFLDHIERSYKSRNN